MTPKGPVSTAVAQSCSWCGAGLDDARPLPGRLVCATCGAASTHPWPTPEELDEAYGLWYRPPAGRFSGGGDVILRRTRARLASRIARKAPPGPVLDVGAGEGTLVRALRLAGREAEGLERSSDGSGLVRPGDIEDERGDWAAIVFWHSLEHLPRPGAAIDAAVQRLAPGGLLIVAVPNIDSLQASAFGSRWFGLDPPRHLVHLPAPALVHRLRERGLLIQRESHLRGGQVVFGWLHGLVGNLPGHPDLYDAIRRPDARRAPVGAPLRVGMSLAALSLTPLALAGAATEAALRRGGTVYVEARR